MGLLVRLILAIPGMRRLFVAALQPTVDPEQTEDERIAVRAGHLQRENADLNASPYSALFASEALELCGLDIVDIREHRQRIYAISGTDEWTLLPRSTEVWQETNAPLN